MQLTTVKFNICSSPVVELHSSGTQVYCCRAGLLHPHNQLFAQEIGVAGYVGASRAQHS